MEGSKTKYFSTCEDPTTAEYKNSIIIVVLFLLLLSLLGINVCIISGGIVDFITDIFAPIFRNVLDMFGHSFGAALKHGAEDLTEGAKVGVEVVGSSVADAGDIIMEQTKKEGFTDLDAYLNESPHKPIQFE
jgi:hypothetical protein